MKNSLKKFYSNILNEDVAQVKHVDISGVIKSVTYDIDNFDNFENHINQVYTNNIKNQDDEDTSLLTIASKFSSIEFPDLVALRKKCYSRDPNFKFRIKPRNEEEIINHLNKYFKEFTVGANKTTNRIGPGELSVNLAFETTNWDNKLEPDAIVRMFDDSVKRISCKSFATDSKKLGGLSRGEAMTGQSDSAKPIREKMNEILSLLRSVNNNIENDASINSVFINDLINYIKQENVKKDRYGNDVMIVANTLIVKKFINNLKKLINELKECILKEHNTDFILVWDGMKFIKTNNIDDFGITTLNYKQLRTSFCYMKAYSETEDYIDKEYFLDPDAFIEYFINNVSGFKDAYVGKESWEIFTDLRNLVFKERHGFVIKSANDFYDKYISRGSRGGIFKVDDKIIDITKKPDGSQSIFTTLTKKNFNELVKNAITDQGDHLKQYKFSRGEKVIEICLDRQLNSLREGIKPRSLLEVYSNLYSQKKNIT